MPVFGALSLQRLATCDTRLQDIAKASILRTDFSVAVGHRGQQEQEEAVALGRSKLHWPKSAHNSMPSRAMDLVPWPVDWQDLERFKALAVIVKEEAARLHIPLVWGGDWTTFKDWDHFELGVL